MTWGQVKPGRTPCDQLLFAGSSLSIGLTGTVALARTHPYSILIPRPAIHDGVSPPAGHTTTSGATLSAMQDRNVQLMLRVLATQPTADGPNEPIRLSEAALDAMLEAAREEERAAILGPRREFQTQLKP